jgi:large subunit ribosomal protein L9
MKVILLENVRKVGSIGDIIDVKRGFARNYLISKKKALFTSKENIKEVNKIKRERRNYKIIYTLFSPAFF